MGKFEMTGARSMRIYPEGADIVILETDKDGKPALQYLFERKPNGKETEIPAESPKVPGKKPGSIFDPLAD